MRRAAVPFHVSQRLSDCMRDFNASSFESKNSQEEENQFPAQELRTISLSAGQKLAAEAFQESDGCPHPTVTLQVSRPPAGEEQLQGMWECLFGKLQRQQSLPVSVPGSVEGQLILSPCVMSSEQQNKDKDKNCRERS
ncbi:hypothetical protein G5714_005132 [Onychostoma macrolepis]|uniref:Uncharacterized protein n=1 Tax=Onychostoma macrolepis TaxID=369639 RepID=A0A7J6D6L2_9TELE|nr:hypothetical protein G5714_005132 [Onychostoma macrolepis]